MRTRPAMPSATPILPPVQSPIALGGRRKVTLGQKLGRGSTATVYRAVLESEHLMRRIVAVKVFDGAMAEERDAGVTSLTRAAQRSASIRHPNVVDTYEV